MTTKERYEDAKFAYVALMKVYPFELDDLLDEKWLPVPDDEDYQISNYGRVKSFKYKTPRIMKPRVNHGYLCVELHKDGTAKKFLVSRLVAQLFIPNPLNKPQVNHRDGVKFNNHVSNLEWVTASENIQHAFNAGLKETPSGEDRSDTKLSNQQVRYVRENPDDLTIYRLAERFGVTPSAISLIQLGKTYKAVGGVIRGKKQSGLPRVPDNIRTQIRAEYVYGSKEFGSTALAKKYSVDPVTIINIIHES